MKITVTSTVAAHNQSFTGVLVANVPCAYGAACEGEVIRKGVAWHEDDNPRADVVICDLCLGFILGGLALLESDALQGTDPVYALVGQSIVRVGSTPAKE